MDPITFDSLPGIVAEMNKKLDVLIADRGSALKETDFLMPVEELRNYLPQRPARQTVYCWVHDQKIPFEKYGKRLYFRKSNIDNWLANGRQV